VSLPEKREFFQESAGLFSFGSGTSAGGSLVGVRRREQRDFKLFESRTIGIEQDRRIPLLGGAKIAGRIGKYSLGMMNLQSERAVLDDTTTVPSNNFTAIKLKRDLFTNSYIGLMVLSKQSSSDIYSRAVGSDGFFAFTPEFIVNSSLARSFSPEQGSNRWAGNLGAILNKDWIDISLRYTHIDSLFNPEMGFIRRENIRSADGTLSLTKWINNDYFKSISLINDIDYLSDHHNTLVDREQKLNFEVALASDDEFAYGIHRKYEFLPSEDEIREIKIDRGGYSGYHHYFRFRAYGGRRLAGYIFCVWGDKLDGKSNMLRVSNKIKISNNLNLDLEYTRDRLDLTHGSITAHVLATRGTYSFSTELFAKCYVQWNDADHRVSTNLLLDYIYKPRCHFYLVYNENRDTSIPGSSLVQERVFLVKFTYLWSL